MRITLGHRVACHTSAAQPRGHGRLHSLATQPVLATAVIVTTVVGVLAALPTSPAAAAKCPTTCATVCCDCTTTPTPTPEATVSAKGDPVTMEVRKDHLWDTGSTKGQATGSVLLTNSGGADAEDVGVTGYYSGGKAMVIHWGTDQNRAAPGLVTVAQYSTLDQALSFSWNRTELTNGWIVITRPSTAPVTVAFQIHETVPGWVLLQAFALSLLIALIMTLGLRSRREMQDGDHKLKPGPTWTFKDSWASNATVFGAILGTVLGSTGFLAEVLPGLSTAMFVGFSLLYGFLIGLAPVMIQVRSNDGSTPNNKGVLTASFVVLTAVIGELITVVLLLVRGGVPWPFPVAGCVLLVILLGYYASASLKVALATPGTAGVDVANAATTAAGVASGLTVASLENQDAQASAIKAAKEVMDAAKYLKELKQAEGAVADVRTAPLLL